MIAGVAGCSVYEPPDAATGAAGASAGAMSSTWVSSSTIGGAGGRGAGGDGAGGRGGTSGEDAGATSQGGGAGSTGSGGNAGSPTLDGGAGTAGATLDAGSELGSQDDGSAEADAPCPMEPDDVLCSRLKKNCGTFTAVDACGIVRVAACGVCSEPSTCGGGGTLNVCSGGGPINRARGGTITASVATDVKVTENRDKLFDGDANTKWYVSSSPTPWIAYQFAAGTSYAITSYTVTSANDIASRDPKSWRFEGTNDPGMTTWTVLDTRTDETFAQRFQTNTYSFANVTSYTAYRFFVTANAGSAQFQCAELQLF